MIEYLILNDYLNYEKIIIENCKELSLSTEEAMICIRIIRLLKEKKNMLKIQTIRNTTLFSEEQCADIINSLLEKNIIGIDMITSKNGKISEVFNLNGLFVLIEKNCNNHKGTEANEKEDTIADNQVLKHLITLLENTFNRSLTHREIDTIHMWIDQNISINKINQAIEAAISNHRLNITYIDACLIQSNHNSEEVDTKKTQVIQDFLKRIKR